MVAARIKTFLLCGLIACGSAAFTPTSAFAEMETVVIENEPTRPFADAPYWDASLPMTERVDDLLARMTLEEKVAQLQTIWTEKSTVQDDSDALDFAKMRARYPNGLGFFARPHDRRGPGSPRVTPPRSIEESIAYINALQTWARTYTRLGIPILAHEESLHGFAALDATSFPQSIGLASTWDPDLVQEINAYIATEVRARGVHQVLSPVVDIARDPRWGRIEETFGEDPFLVGEMGVAAVLGLSGDGSTDMLPSDKVHATLKHMTGHGQPESGVNIAPAQISERHLRENFFPPFEQVVSRTPIASVMASYNEIDGIPSHANEWLLDDVLRGEWGFDGVIVSDYFAIEDLTNIHRVAADIPDAARMALNAGIDVDLPNGAAFESLVDLVRNGSVAETRIDNAVRRVLEMKFRAGMFEDPFVRELEPALGSNGPQGVALARLAAERSMILLKNDGTLPLVLPEGDDEKPTIAVIGPNADVVRLGGYYGIPRQTVSPLAGIRSLVGDKANIIYHQGVAITENDDWWADEVVLADPESNRQGIAEAVALAAEADIVLLFVGDTEQTSREGWATNHLGDRTSLDLVGEQMELFDALKALGKPVVAVLVNGRPPSYPRLADEANAILETWYAGEQQGNAIADALFGKVNPGGKLPVTVVRNAGQIPMFYNYKPSARRGYLFDEVTPLYPFGFGLSYTSFEIGDPQLSSQEISVGEAVTVRVNVTNSGERSGDEVVQVYLRDDVSSVTRPVKELVAFERIGLNPGETQAVDLFVSPEAFALWNRDMERVIEPGEFTIMVGSNSRDLKQTSLTIVE